MGRRCRRRRWGRRVRRRAPGCRTGRLRSSCVSTWGREADGREGIAVPIELSPNNSGAAAPLWFRLSDEEAGPAGVVHFAQIERDNQGRRDALLCQAMIYANRPLVSLYDLATPNLQSRSAAPWNVAASICNTAASMIIRNKVRLTVETSGADRKLRRQAKEASRWINGVLAANNVSDEIAAACFMDAAVCDVGVPVIRVEGGRITVERVFPDELIVSDAECVYGKPHQIAIKKYFPRFAVLEKYGDTDEKRAAIGALLNDNPSYSTTYKPDLIPVYEFWAIQGKHIVAVTGATLAFESWPYDRLPLPPLYIERPQAGFYGRGFVQQVSGYSYTLFQLNADIEECIRLGASPKWMVSTTSLVNEQQLANLNMGIVNHSPGQEPKLVSYPSVPAELLNERQRNYEQAMRDVGLSEWGVTGKQPTGDPSGVALDSLRDREQGRIINVGQTFEAWHVATAEICLMLAPRCRDWKVQGQGPGDRDMRDVNFAQIADFIKNAPWRVQPPAPIAAFPSDPAGKRKQIESWVAMKA